MLPSLPVRVVAALWVVVALAVTVRTIHRPTSHTVFPVFLAGAERWWHDQALHGEKGPVDHFRYLPPFALMVTPFTALGVTLGGVVWTWTTLTVYWIGLRRLQRDVLPGEWTAGRQGWYLLLALAGALSGIWNAQSNTLLIGMLMLGASALARQRWWQAAFWFAVPVAAKATPLPIALLCCVLWPRPFGWRFVVVLLLGLMVPFFTRPAPVVCWQYQDWMEKTLITSQLRWPGYRDGWSVWLVVEHLWRGAEGLPDITQKAGSARVYMLVQAMSGLGVLCWCLWQQRQNVETRALLTGTLGMGLGWLMLFGPASEHPTYAFLAPLLAWGVVQRDLWPGGRRLVEAAGMLILVLAWSAISQPLWPWCPWLRVSLPLGSGVYLLWLGSRRWTPRADLRVAPLALRPRLLGAMTGALQPAPWR